MANEMVSIPYAVYEAQQERNDRSNKRLWILTIILIIALLASNIAWIIYESQFETVVDESDTVISLSQEAENDNYFVGRDGNIGG